ncbi:hypothetical protein [Streptosporangium vulgare]|uniref:hypothetical protein n=1 Tax=Streptosporangium vulgare TaxID=46190 RepID=UPI0031D78A28
MLTRVADTVPSLLSEQLHLVVAEGPDALARFNGWNDRFWVRGLVLFGAWLGDYRTTSPSSPLPGPDPPLPAPGPPRPGRGTHPSAGLESTPRGPSAHPSPDPPRPL